MRATQMVATQMAIAATPKIAMILSLRARLSLRRKRMGMGSAMTCFVSDQMGGSGIQGGLTHEVGEDVKGIGRVYSDGKTSSL